MNRYKSVILALENTDRLKEHDPEALYYLGEAYRQRGISGDDKLAERAYLDALSANPKLASPHRALGIHYMKQNNPELAEKYLGQYLRLAPSAPDRRYIEQYYTQVKKGGH